MLPLLFLCFTLLPAIEIYLLIKVGGQIGALHTFGLLLFMGFLGAAIAKSQGRALLLQAQAALSRGELPAASALHGLLVIFGGVLMVTPGFFTDVLGFLFVLPGPRHLMVVLMKRYLAKQLELGRIHVFGGAAAGGGFRTGSRGPFEGPQPPPGASRDVSPKVIDVTATRVEDKPKAKTSTDDEPK